MMTKTTRLFPVGIILLLILSTFAPPARAQIFVSYQGNNTVQQFTTGGVGTLFASGLDFPAGLTLDSAGNVYVAKAGNSTVMKFTSGGGAGSQFAAATVNGPNGLAFDSAGNLYVANAGHNTIMKFAPGPGSVGAVFARTGLNTPVFIAIQPTDCLFFAGFARWRDSTNRHH